MTVLELMQITVDKQNKITNLLSNAIAEINKKEAVNYQSILEYLYDIEDEITFLERNDYRKVKVNE